MNDGLVTQPEINASDARFTADQKLLATYVCYNLQLCLIAVPSINSAFGSETRARRLGHCRPSFPAVMSVLPNDIHFKFDAGSGRLVTSRVGVARFGP